MDNKIYIVWSRPHAHSAWQPRNFYKKADIANREAEKLKARHSNYNFTVTEAHLSEPTNRFTVGHSFKDNQPCILEDGDSVVAIFPSMPYGAEQAEQVCQLMNTYM